MKYDILAYAMNDSLPLFTEADVKKLTHINLSFGLIRDGLLDLSMLGNIGLIQSFRRWNPALKIVLSIGGWGAGGFSTMAKTEKGRNEFAHSCLEQVERLGLDGIDIDWEYPCSDQAEIDCDPADRENFTLLLQALRDCLGERSLSIAAGAGEYFIEGTQMERVAEIVDYVQIMTYDMRGGFSHQTGHHAALFAGENDQSGLNTHDMVELFHRAGVPYEKLVVGAAFYSRRWTGVKNDGNGLNQPAESVGSGGPRYSDLTPEFLERGGFSRCWDDSAKAAYLWNGSEFISYESPEAIRCKAEFVKDKGLRGIMYWEHGCDTTGELLQTIFETLEGK